MPQAIHDLIAAKAVTTHFQPIVSVKKRAVVGVEALSRGLDGPLRLYSPLQMFSWAQEASLVTELDDLCRATALQLFSAWPQRRPGLLLFLNLDASRLNQGQMSAMAVQHMVTGVGLRPQDVVLEFSDRDAAGAPGLRMLMETCQSFGFTVALTDLDGSPAGLRRVTELKPNIAKAEHSLVAGVHRDPVRQQLLRSLSALTRLHGGLTVAVGVETEDDASACLDQGADLLQGFHFGRPNSAQQLPMASFQASVERSASKAKAMAVGRAQMRQRENERHLKLLERILKALRGAHRDTFEACLAGFVNGVASLECLYVLDHQGFQVTSTVVWQHQKEAVRSQLFAPAPLGADHSLKDYFLSLTLSGQDLYVSDPYVSLATGNLCRTLTAGFGDEQGVGHVLCMDIRSA